LALEKHHKIASALTASLQKFLKFELSQQAQRLEISTCDAQFAAGNGLSMTAAPAMMKPAATGKASGYESSPAPTLTKEKGPQGPFPCAD